MVEMSVSRWQNSCVEFMLQVKWICTTSDESQVIYVSYCRTHITPQI